MTARHRPWACLVLCAVVLAPVSAAQAQQAPPEDARTLFQQGVASADQERWGDAVEFFRRSRAIVERPSTIFNLGHALMRLGRYTDAIQTFEDFLRLSNPSRDAAQRSDALLAVNSAHEALGRLELTVSPESAQIQVDGSALEGAGTVRRLALDPGERTITVTAEGHQAQTFTVYVLLGMRDSRAIELVTRDAAAATQLTVPTPETAAATEVTRPPARRGDPMMAQPPPRDREGNSIFDSPVFWVITGAVVVGAGVGIGVALSSGSDDPYGGSTGVVLSGP